MKSAPLKSWIGEWVYISFSAVVIGLVVALFINSLNAVTALREASPWFLFFLPLAGFAVGWVYHELGREVQGGNNLILDEIHNPQSGVPFKMAPLIFLGTLVTHLAGGSAGREGSAVQMGGSLSDQVAKFFKVSRNRRLRLLMAGAGAGFGAVIGAPLAGGLFGIEVLEVGKIKWMALPQCLLASYIAHQVSLFWGADHVSWGIPIFPEEWTLFVFLSLGLAGVLFGGVARCFCWLTHRIGYVFDRWISYSPLRPVWGGLLLIVLYQWEGSYFYDGLGLDRIQLGLQQASSPLEPLYKMLFTSLTLGSGFKGGEFTPLVFMGVTLGSSLSLWLPLSCSFLGVLGFSAVFGAASNTPLACSVMVSELFGWHLLPVSLGVSYIAFYVSGDKGIYSSQKLFRTKWNFKKIPSAYWKGTEKK